MLHLEHIFKFSISIIKNPGQHKEPTIEDRRLGHIEAKLDLRLDHSYTVTC